MPFLQYRTVVIELNAIHLQQLFVNFLLTFKLRQLNGSICQCFCCNRSCICLKKIFHKSNGVLSWIKKILLGICKKIDEYEKSKYKRSQKKSSLENALFFISIKHDGIYLNDIKIIDKKAELQFVVFKLLLEQHLLELLNFRKSGLKSYHIANKLEESSKSDISEKQIRQIIYRIRNSIIEKFNQSVGDKIIQFDSSSEYFLGKNVVLISS
jgi:hypothetical protein